MGAYLHIWATLIAAVALLGSCLLTRWLVVDRYNVSFLLWPAVVALILLLVFGQHISAGVTGFVISLGFSSLVAVVVSVGALAAVSGVIFAFVTAKKR